MRDPGPAAGRVSEDALRILLLCTENTGKPEAPERVEPTQICNARLVLPSFGPNAWRRGRPGADSRVGPDAATRKAYIIACIVQCLFGVVPFACPGDVTCTTAWHKAWHVHGMCMHLGFAQCMADHGMALRCMVSMRQACLHGAWPLFRTCLSPFGSTLRAD